jgi:Holliday junction DNA helicase RuvA
LITRIRGQLTSLSDTSAYIQVDHFEYEVFIPQFVQRQLQGQIGETVELRTIEYIDGNPQKGKLIPRLIGFISDVERDFFDVFCSVDGVGVKTALKAMNRPVRDVAIAIEEQNVTDLTTLPGIGASTAERIVAKLRKKMTRFALMVRKPGSTATEELGPDLLQESYDALVILGHSSQEARQQVDRVMSTKGKRIKTVEDVLRAIYEEEREVH